MMTTSVSTQLTCLTELDCRTASYMVKSSHYASSAAACLQQPLLVGCPVRPDLRANVTWVISALHLLLALPCLKGPYFVKLDFLMMPGLSRMAVTG